MNIDFMMSEGDAPEDVRVLTRQVLDYARERVGCPEDAVAEVIIADQKHFGNAVRRLSPNSPYTDNEEYRAVGKTLRLGGSENAVVSFGIVLLDFILLAAYAASSKPNDRRSNAENLGLYVICHEFSHAKDGLRRPQCEAIISVADAQGRFKIRHIATYFKDIVLGEIFACYESASVCTQAMLEDEVAGANKIISSQLRGVSAEVAGYRGDVSHLRRIAFMAAQAFWLPFVQHGKSIAHQIGNPNLLTPSLEWPDAAVATREILQEYALLVREVIASYPDLPKYFDDKLLCLWRSMAFLNGYEFREHMEGDGIFWTSGARRAPIH